jgi:hypothetical protein
MSWCRTATGSWSVFGLLLAGGCLFVAYGSFADPGAHAARDEVGYLLGLVYLTALGMTFGLAGGGTWRRAAGWWYRRHPERLADLVAQLESASYAERVRALQTIAEAYGEPFGPVAYGSCRPEQVEALGLLYREWWQAHHGSGSPSPEVRRAALLRCVIARLRVLHETDVLPGSAEVKHASNADLARLPPVPVEVFVARLRPRAEELLRRVAAILSHVSPDATLAASEGRIRRLFARLCWEACAYGWRLRFDTAERRLPPTPSPPNRPPLATPLGWAEKYRRLSGSFPDEQSPGASGEGTGGKEMTWAELAAALHRKVDDTLERLADTIKDTLLDGQLPASEDDAETAPVVPVARERFVEAMRPRIEEALRGMADSLNERRDADAVGELLEALLRDALQTGLAMRRPPADGSLRPQESLHDG